MNPLISICLPVRNGAAYISQAVESILSQNRQDFELLIADDCSDDDSFALVNKYAAKDRRIKAWRNQERLGLFANYNQCLKNSLGFYIKPMAQDDVLMPQMLNECVSRFEQTKSLVLVSTAKEILDERTSGKGLSEDKTSPATIFGEDRETFNRQEIWQASLMPLRNIIGEPSTVMFRADASDSGFCQSLHHLGDLELWLRLLRHGDYAFINRSLVSVRRHKDSATTKNLSQLRIASDMVHCQVLLRDILRECGIVERDFINANIASFSKTVGAQLSNDFFSDELAMCGEEQLCREEELALKKALLYSLALISDSNFDPLVASVTGKIRRQEARLRYLLESVPWRATRPLRELNKFLHGTNLNHSKHPKKRTFTDNTEYLQSLNMERRKILCSRSWRLSRRLRSVVKKLRQNT